MNRQNFILPGIVVALFTGFVVGRVTAPGPNPRFVQIKGVTGYDQLFDNKTAQVCSTLTHEEFLRKLQGVPPGVVLTPNPNPVDATWNELQQEAKANSAVYCADLQKKGW